jgi:hypothetical protein
MSESALDLAVRRLDRAVTQLEQRMHDRLAKAGADGGGLFEQDRAKLASELDAARSREKALESAGAEASAALGRAIAEIRAALERDESEDPPIDDDDDDAEDDDDAVDQGDDLMTKGR